MSESLLQMRPGKALFITVAIVAVMGVTMIGLGWLSHISVTLVLCGLFAYGKLSGQSFDAMQRKMAAGVMSGIGAIYLFFLSACWCRR